MANISFSPNPNDCACNITGSGGGALGGNESHTITYTLKKWRYETTPMPHWEPDGNVSETTQIRTKSAINYARWGAVVTGNLDQQPLDGHIFFTSIERVRAFNGSTIEEIQYDGNVWDIANASGTTVNENAQHETTTTTYNPTGYRLNSSSFGWNNIKAELEFDPGCLVFATVEDLDDYLTTGNTENAINTPVPEPETQTGYDYYMYNQITNTVGAGLNYEYYYRYTMNPNERLALYLKEDGSPYDRVLKGVGGIAQIYKGDSYSEEVFPMASSTQTQFLGLRKKLDSGTTWTPIMYETNIPTFDTEAHADNYILTGDETGIIDKWRTDDVEPGEIGEPTDNTPQGENGMVLTYGGKMYRMSNLQLFHFYEEIFDGQSSTINAILDGLQLFGANQINAIQGVTYFPFDVSHVAQLSIGSDIYIGAYKITSTTGDVVQKNNKLINMGTVYYAPPYGARDFRNYEPGCKLYIMLPFAGLHELQISKYIGKNVTLKMAVDLATGTGTYFLYAGNTIMDTFDCLVGVHRPITAVDHAQHVSASMNAILQTGTSAIKTLEAGASKNLGGVAGGAINTVLQGYQTLQTVNDAPMSTRGSFTGGTGLFDVKSPYFIFAQMKPQTPANLQAVMGRPSSAGGLVNSFSGYLSTCAFTLADGFTGTQEEAEEIYNLMAGGVYID